MPLLVQGERARLPAVGFEGIRASPAPNTRIALAFVVARGDRRDDLGILGDVLLVVVCGVCACGA